MVAIRITQKILDQNNQNWIVNKTVGDIILRNEYPNRFYVDENVIGGYANRNDLHNSDGWRPFIRNTSFDPVTQKEYIGNIVKVPQGAPLASVTHYEYKIKDLTQQEQGDLVLENENNESRTAIIQYKEDGINHIERVRAKMYRRVVQYPNGEMALKKTQLAKLERWMKDTYCYLLVGNFRQASNELISLIKDRDDVTGDGTLLEAKGMLETVQWFETEVTDYFDNEYLL